MARPLRERGRLLEATKDAPATRRPIQIITPGWGSSGYYSAAVLERAAENKVVPAGTHMYFDHASNSEHADRPERSVRDIAAVLVEDATWDGERLIAEADILGPHSELIEALAPYIGVSISGSATDITIGEAEGRRGPIIEDLAFVESVDFVTHAGRGGAVLLESARPSLVNARAIGHGVAEATANETREQLQQQLRDAFGGEKSWVWVRDFDETTCWYEHETPDESGTYGITYETADNGAISLVGDPTEVRATTTYVPVTRPGSTTTTTEESEEDTMGNIQIDEAEHRSLVEKAGRVDVVEATLAERDRRDAAAVIITEAATTAGVEFDALQTAGLLANLPVTEAGALDVDAFTNAVTEAAKGLAERQAATSTGSGVVGFGASTSTETAVTESAPTKSPWGRPLGESKGA